MTNPVERLHAAGQSIWLDSINRVMITSGTLARYVDELAVTGLTSNPTILGHAMAASHDYDDSLRHHLAAGITDPQDLVYTLALEDLGAAAALFRPRWEETSGADGYVSRSLAIREEWLRGSALLDLVDEPQLGPRVGGLGGGQLLTQPGERTRAMGG